MSRQTNLFSSAIEHKLNSKSALVNLDLQLAGKEITLARKIDPYLADIRLYEQVIDFLGKELDASHNKNVLTNLAEIWGSIPEAVLQKKISREIVKFLDFVIASFILNHIKPGQIFVDSNAKLHKGVCWLMTGKRSEAHKALLNTLSSTHWGRADLWGYLGDSSCLLGNFREASTAYLNALVIDPQKLDTLRLKWIPLLRLYQELLTAYSDLEARSLLLTFVWLNDFLKIPRKNTPLRRFAVELTGQLNPEKIQNASARYRTFSTYLFIDQSQEQGELNIQVREKMMNLSPELFKRYLKKLETLHNGKK